MKRKTSTGATKRSARNLPAKKLDAAKAGSVRGGRKAGGTQQEYLVITMKDAQISSSK